MVLTYFKTPLEPHAVHQSQTKKTDGRWKEAPGEMGLCLSFTATMEHVCFVLLLLFTHTVCISWQENYITSCVRAFHRVTGPHGINGCFFGKLLYERGPIDPVVSCVYGHTCASCIASFKQEEGSEACISTNHIRLFLQNMSGVLLFKPMKYCCINSSVFLSFFWMKYNMTYKF